MAAVSGAVKSLSKKVAGLPGDARAAVGDSVLLLVGLLTLASALLGAVALYRLLRGPLLR